MASKIKVDQIAESTTSAGIELQHNVTIPTGKTLTVTDGLAIGSLPTVTVAKGGTNLTSFAAGDVLYATGSTTLAKLPKGTAEQILSMNSGATLPEWTSADISVLPTITVAKGGTGQAGGFTAGDILYATGATTLAKLAKGTASQQLAMNAGATAPEWTTVAAPSSDFVLLATDVTSSATATVSLDGYFSSTYQNYFLIGTNCSNDGSDENLDIRFRQADADVTGSSYFRIWNGDYGTNGNAANRYDGASYGSSSIMITNNWDPAVTKVAQFSMWFYNPLNTTAYKHITWHSCNTSPNSTRSYMNFSGAANYYGNTTALSGFTFLCTSGDNITTMNLKLYGLK